MTAPFLNHGNKKYLLDAAHVSIYFRALQAAEEPLAAKLEGGVGQVGVGRSSGRQG